jgi:hypothetical protein
MNCARPTPRASSRRDCLRLTIDSQAARPGRDAASVRHLHEGSQVFEIHWRSIFRIILRRGGGSREGDVAADPPPSSKLAGHDNTASQAAILVLLVLTAAMLMALFSRTAPHPPLEVAPFALAPFLGASLAIWNRRDRTWPARQPCRMRPCPALCAHSSRFVWSSEVCRHLAGGAHRPSGNHFRRRFGDQGNVRAEACVRLARVRCSFARSSSCFGSRPRRPPCAARLRPHA